MRYIVCLVLILLTTPTLANQKAITDTGDEVILFDNGTWEYTSQIDSKEKVIPENTKKFIKPSSSTFQLKSKKNSSSVWINSKDWMFTKAKNNPEAEYEFQLKGQDLYAMSISEGIEIQLENLTEIALENARAFAPDATVIEKEYRTVNGKKVIYMSMRGTGGGIRFQYIGYYYSDSTGSTQLIVYTGDNMVKKYQKEIFDFLNGFDVQ